MRRRQSVYAGLGLSSGPVIVWFVALQTTTFVLFLNAGPGLRKCPGYSTRVRNTAHKARLIAVYVREEPQVVSVTLQFDAMHLHRFTNW